jgi:YfiH family protein
MHALARFPELVHGISVRSTPDGADWNLSSKRGTPQDPPSMETAIRNREKLADALGISPRQMASCRQVHGSEVVVVGQSEAGRGIYPDLGPTPDADAMVTGEPGIFLMALSADCPPIFVYDPVRRVVGLAHSGWKGTVARIAANVVETMRGEFGSRPADLIVGVGPGIGPCCYKVGENVVEAAGASFGEGAWLPSDSGDHPILSMQGGDSYFNLREAIRTALVDAGVQPDHLHLTHACTAHNTGLFYSHRAEAGQCGLFGAVLGLRA